MAFPERLLRTQDNIQLSYDLPHRINAAISFPILSPNGSTILIYAHESGIRVIWRGGRRFAPPRSPTNGNTKASSAPANDAIMIIDSSDEEAAPPPAPIEATFEDHEPELEASHPFPAILTYIDILFHTPATAIASYEKVADKIIIAAACADGTVRLITLPLTPPSPAQLAATAKSPQAGRYNETTQILHGPSTPPALIAITQQPGASQSAAADALPSLLIGVSYPREVTGTVLLHTIPLPSSAASSKHPHAQPQTLYLPSPPSALSFSSSSSSAPTLLLGFPSGCIRLFSPSTSTWLLTLHVPFRSSSPTRKGVLDATYVFAGRSILVLLDDATWGLWDLSGLGPTPPPQGKTILGPAGIRGGALTPFALEGTLHDGAAGWGGVGASSSASRGDRGGREREGFVPMTPATRKVGDVGAAFVRGTTPAEKKEKGGIAIRHTESGMKGMEMADEEVLLWSGERVVQLKSLRAYWTAKTEKGGTLFGGKGREGMVRGVRGVKCCGEAWGGVLLLGQGEMCVRAEQRLVFVRERGAEGGSRGVGEWRGGSEGEEEGESDVEGEGEGLQDLERRLEGLERRRIASAGAGRAAGQGFRSLDSRV